MLVLSRLLGCLLLLALCVPLVSGEQNYYQILGIPKNAPNSQIKAAFRKLSKQYHPDVSQEPDAKKKFQEISEAYGILSDEEQRKIYDRHGKEGLKQHQQGGGGHPFADIKYFLVMQRHLRLIFRRRWKLWEKKRPTFCNEAAPY